MKKETIKTVKKLIEDEYNKDPENGLDMFNVIPENTETKVTAISCEIPGIFDDFEKGDREVSRDFIIMILTPETLTTIKGRVVLKLSPEIVDIGPHETEEQMFPDEKLEFFYDEKLTTNKELQIIK